MLAAMQALTDGAAAWLSSLKRLTELSLRGADGIKGTGLSSLVNLPYLQVTFHFKYRSICKGWPTCVRFDVASRRGRL